MLTAIEPQSLVLRRYVDLFYFFKSDETEQWSHVAFPHVNTAISFFRGVSINREHHRISIKGNEGTECHIEILGKYTRPVYVTCEGTVDEIAIVFKPLGVNRFMREDMIQVASDYSQSFHHPVWQEMASALFHANDRIAFLERFLLSILSEQERFIDMERALLLLEDNDPDHSVADVAAKLNVSLKTFQRNFTKMMACSPTDYKRIARFRNSLQSRFRSNDLKSLTSITYEHNYTDQSYFIREFRKLTNQNPKLFFKEVSLVGGDKIVWEIL